MSIQAIGQTLKTAREAAGLSIRQVYEKTKIPLGHLQSIDNGNDEDLPEPVYVAGFVKRYANCVGLDGRKLSEEYKFLVDSAAGKALGNHKSSHPEPIIVTSDHYGRRKTSPAFKTAFFYAFWVLLIGGLLWFLTVKQLSSQLSQQQKDLLSLSDDLTKHTPVAAIPDNGTQASSTTNTEAVNPAATSTNGVQISLSANQHVWVEVKSSSTGENLYTGFFEIGDQRNFQDPQGLHVRAGNGGALRVAYQGKTEVFGQPGKPTDKDFLPTTTLPVNQPGATTTSSTVPTTPTTNTTTTANTTTPSTTQDLAKKASVTTGLPRKKPSPRYNARLNNTTTDQYLPGESLGGTTRSIEVPYRFDETTPDTNN